MLRIPEPSVLQAQIDAVETEARREGVTLYGAGGFARAVYSALQGLGITVQAFVVSQVTKDRIDDVPIISLQELDQRLSRLPMWIAVFNREAISDLTRIANSISARGGANPRLPQEYFELIQGQLGWRYWLTDRRQYAAYRPQLEAALQMLVDDESRQQFYDAVSFRIWPEAGRAPPPSLEAQYFPVHVAAALRSSARRVVFVDGGAFDGDTLLQASTLLELEHAFAFEPDEANFGKLACNTQALPVPVVCIPCGLSSRVESLKFARQGEASSIGDAGSSHIQCVSIDQCLGKQRVDFLKLDVEGHELPALHGATELIQRCQSALAVAAYHRWDDMWRIPSFIHQHLPNHAVSYRAHQYNTFDGVFYAVRH